MSRPADIAPLPLKSALWLWVKIERQYRRVVQDLELRASVGCVSWLHTVKELNVALGHIISDLSAEYEVFVAKLTCS